MLQHLSRFFIYPPLQPQNLVMDSQGNVLFTGTFQGQLNWEGPNGTAITLQSENYAAFFVKYSAKNPRTILWASQVVEQAQFALPMLNIVAGCKPDARYSLVLISDSNRFGGQRHLNGSIHWWHFGTLIYPSTFSWVLFAGGQRWALRTIAWK